MSTQNERKALWFLALIAVSGSGVRVYRAASAPPTLADSVALETQLRRVDSSAAHRSDRARKSATVTRDTTATVPLLDIDRASASDIEGLPGVGPAMAARIVAARDSAGGFGSIEALCVVRGVGPALRERLRPLVTFTSAPRPVSDACGGASRRSKKLRAARSRERS